MGVLAAEAAAVVADRPVRGRCGVTAIHSVRADRIRDHAGRPTQPLDIYRLASSAITELIEGIANDDVDLIIGAERRLVAVGGLAQVNANILELGRRT